MLPLFMYMDSPGLVPGKGSFLFHSTPLTIIFPDRAPTKEQAKEWMLLERRAKMLLKAAMPMLMEKTTLMVRLRRKSVSRWLCNLLICIGFAFVISTTAAATAEVLDKTFMERTGHTLLSVCGLMVADRAALAVSVAAGIEETEPVTCTTGIRLVHPP